MELSDPKRDPTALKRGVLRPISRSESGKSKAQEIDQDRLPGMEY
ncbi:unnamed protein product [Periconia digitata]|uniref:Uncharacterized protein n=1 Tax=Periconia digitata TaxID=1303443 RepID=A0A9W4U9I9_9PLEO|nr:unnamed protein product [Periconia digitata]